MLMLNLLGNCLRLIQLYSPNSSALCSEFAEEISDALRRAKTNAFNIYFENFHARFRNNAGL